MEVSFNEAVDTVRAAWECNTTTADSRWSLKQLHGLYNLLIENRDEIISILGEESGFMQLQLERDFAFLIEDISQCISFSKQGKCAQTSCRTHFGHALTYLEPKGASLIVSNTTNPLRYALQPLASSIAARNAVILVSNQSPKLFSFLQRIYSKYLDSFAIQILSTDGKPIKPGHLDDRVDHVLIIDTSSDDWSDILGRPSVDFSPSIQGVNLVVIDEGPSAMDSLVQDILDCSRPTQPLEDAISAVFVHQHHFDSVVDNIKQKEKGSKASASSLPDTPECKPLVSNIFTVELSQIGSTSKRLQELMLATRDSRCLLLIRCTSMDQIIDACGNARDVRLISILGQVDNKSKSYFKDWTKSKFVSFGSIQNTVQPVTDLSNMFNRTVPWTSYPISLFSQPRVVLLGMKQKSADTVTTIRKSYANRIPKLKPEPLGWRVGFFTQVEYTFKAVAGTVGVLSLVGLWYAGKAIRKHL